MSHFLRTVVFRAGLESLFFSGAYALSHRGMKGIGIIFTLHHVRDYAGPSIGINRELEVTPAFLETAIEAARADGVEFVDLDEAARRLRSPEPVRRFAAVTLDDGYRDNLEVAAPVFIKHGVPFTVFATTGFVRRQHPIWWKLVEEVVRARRVVAFNASPGGEVIQVGTIAEKTKVAYRIANWLRDLPPARCLAEAARFAEDNDYDPMLPTRRDVMTEEELRRFAALPLATLGAHTRTHPNLALLDEAEALAEMVGGADDLEAITGLRPRHFAYPYGYPSAAGSREFALAKRAGFDLALTTRPGVLHPEHAGHATALPRVSLNGHFQARRHVDVLMSGAPFALKNRFRRLDVA